MRRGIGLLALLVLALGAASGCARASRAMNEDDGPIEVDPSGGGDYATIQEAVDAAVPGATIVLQAGTYVEQIVVEKALTLRGTGAGTQIDFPGPGQPDPTDSGVEDPVIRIRDTADVRIESLGVRGPRDGIRVSNSTNVVLVAIVASGNGDEGLDISAGVNITVSGTFEANGDDGVQVRDASRQVTVKNSVARNNVQDGFKIKGSTDCLLQGNTSTINGDDGILVRDSSAIRVKSNEATDNVGYGIRVSFAPDTLLEDNSASGNMAGDIQID